MSETEPEITAEQLKEQEKSPREKEIDRVVGVLAISYAASEGDTGVQTLYLKRYAALNEDLNSEFVRSNKDDIVKRFADQYEESMAKGKTHTLLDRDLIVADVPQYIDSLAQDIDKKEMPTIDEVLKATNSLIQKEEAYQYKGRERIVNGKKTTVFTSQLRDSYLNSQNSRSPMTEFYNYLFEEIKASGQSDNVVLKENVYRLEKEFMKKHPDEVFDPMGKLDFLKDK